MPKLTESLSVIWKKHGAVMKTLNQLVEENFSSQEREESRGKDSRCPSPAGASSTAGHAEDIGAGNGAVTVSSVGAGAAAKHHP